MNIGEKIRTLRSERHMTQQELAGEEITRNMLSRIENGCALPSVPTLLYLAERLGVPAGFLIADGEEDGIYRKSAEIAKIRESYRLGDWIGCERLCGLLASPDAETERYVTGCRYHEAKDCFGFGELGEAYNRFLAVRKRCENASSAAYPDDILQRVIDAECAVYLQCLSDISPYFICEPITRNGIRTEAFGDPFCVYYSFYRPNGCRPGGSRPADAEAEAYIRTRDTSESFYTEHIHARLLMKKGQYREACRILREIAYGESLIPQPVLLFMLSDLEICFRELSDFKSAYECAGLHRELLDSFLRDVTQTGGAT